MDTAHKGVAPVMGDADELIWFWNERDAEIGLQSSHGIAVNREQGLAVPRDASVGSLEHAACWGSPNAGLGACVRQALQRLPPHHMVVLYAAYGPRSPAARTDVLDEMTARVAPYTPVVEEARLAMARRIADARVAAAWEAMQTAAARRPAVVEAANTRMDRADRRFRHLAELRGERRLSDKEMDERYALRREIEAGRRAIADVSRAPLDAEAMDRIARTHAASAMLEVGPVDALRWMLGPPLVQERGESKATFVERKARILDLQDDVERLTRGAREALEKARAAYGAARGEAR